MSAATKLHAIVRDNRLGLRRALPSWCTAHSDTLTAIFKAHGDGEDPILIEATCNQVNQEGGYTGMTPAKFRNFVECLAKDAGVEANRLILGGDHLGPNPWKWLPAREAMLRARDLVRAFVEAGFVKIHLDASMRCADDEKLTEAVIAERAAALCRTAEEAGDGPDLAYVIGTEVPIPGGETEPIDALAVTPVLNVRQTINLHREAFDSLGVGAAMSRVVAIVVQPGVDFGNNYVVQFNRAEAAGLADALNDFPEIVFEGHSTDFQTLRSLENLVDCHFGFLKVGPELTFAFREAIFAMAAIECGPEGMGDSDVVRALDRAMEKNPESWRSYVHAGPKERVDRLFGLSDRVRYYWRDQDLAAAVNDLKSRVDFADIAPGLVSQFAGALDDSVGTHSLSERLVQSRVGAVVARYRAASRRLEHTAEFKSVTAAMRADFL
jgi:D-tagatose-bisphosphate aldolase class II non-catalytic subunit